MARLARHFLRDGARRRAALPACASFFFDGVERLRVERIGAFEMLSLEREGDFRRLIDGIENAFLSSAAAVSEELRTTGRCARSLAEFQTAGD